VQYWRLTASLNQSRTSAELKEALQVIWGNLPQGPIDKVVKDFSNKMTGGWLVLQLGTAGSEHFEHSQ